MISYLYGSDTYAARQAIEETRKKANATMHWLDRRDLEHKPLSARMDEGSGSLFGAQLIVVRDPGSMPKVIQEDIQQVVKKGVGSCVLWDRGMPDKRSGLWKAVKKQAVLYETPDNKALSVWLIEEAKKQEVEFAPGVISLFIERVGTDRWKLLAELERVALTAPIITMDVLNASVLPGQISVNVFGMLDAIASGQKTRALNMMELLLQEGESEIGILALLAYQYRTILAVKMGGMKGMSAPDIAREYKIHPFAVQKNSPIARKYTENQLQDILTRIMAMDAVIKRGGMDAKTGLSMLVLGFFQQQKTTA